MLKSSTSMTGVGLSPYRDTQAGGLWSCGANTRWGAFPSRSYNQLAAGAPPCTEDRMAVRDAIRDTWSGGDAPGCCNSEEYLNQGSAWPWGAASSQGLNGSTAATERQGGAQPTGSQGNTLDQRGAYESIYDTANLAQLSLPLPIYLLRRN
jgi:hypothetical protein